MPVSVKHAKTNIITDWTQTDLDNIIAGQPAPLPPSGTLISQITLPSDWNADHTISTSGASNGQVLTVVAGQAEWATPSSGGGNVVGPASATDNAVARYDLTTGKVIQNSGVIIDDSNNVSGIGTLAAGTTTLTSNSTQALAVGANGATNPAFRVNASTASAATGVALTGNAAGAGADLTAISSGVNENLRIDAKGSGTLTLNGTATGNILLNRATSVTSNAAQAIAVGANGATNPAFQVNANAASSATGVQITSAAAGGGVLIQAISSATDEGLRIAPKGAGGLTLDTGTGANALTFRTNATSRFTINNSQYIFSGIAASGSSSARWQYVSTANTALSANLEIAFVDWNTTSLQQHATGTVTLQRDYRIRNQTHSAVAASTITDAAAFAVDGAVAQGSNMSITHSSAIYSGGAAVGAGVTNSYAIKLHANTGATNNYICSFNGTAGEIFRTRTDGQIALLATNTAAGTTGAQTINRPSGTVNFAAGATSLVVTNSLCTTASIVFATIRTNDATAVIKNVVPAAGSFTINLNAAATAETSVGFFIIN